MHLTAKADQERKMLTSIRKKASATEPGPKISQVAPDFDLTEISTGKQVSLHQFQGKSPVVLVFGSYSCPNFRSSAGALKSFYQRYGSRVPFLLVYIREAHSTDQWQSTRNLHEAVTLAPAATFAEKSDHASMCSRKLHLPFPAIVDGMDGAVETAYAAWPSRAFIVGEDGRILYSTRLTELDFHADEMDSVLQRLTSTQKISKVQ
jgi:peroxiredoxin